MLKEGKSVQRFQMTLTLDQECHARDSNISKSFIGNDLNYNNYCLECKYILYYWNCLWPRSVLRHFTKILLFGGEREHEVLQYSYYSLVNLKAKKD